MNKNSKFFRLTELAYYMDSGLLDIENLYRLRDYFTDELEIIYTENIELLEYIVRTLAELDLKYKILDNKITVINCPQEQVDFIAWFVPFFMLLESTSNKGSKPNKYHYSIFENEYAPTGLEISKMKFRYKKLEITFEERIL